MQAFKKFVSPPDIWQSLSPNAFGLFNSSFNMSRGVIIIATIVAVGFLIYMYPQIIPSSIVGFFSHIFSKVGRHEIALVLASIALCVLFFANPTFDSTGPMDTPKVTPPDIPITPLVTETNEASSSTSKTIFDTISSHVVDFMKNLFWTQIYPGIIHKGPRVMMPLMLSYPTLFIIGLLILILILILMSKKEDASYG